MTIQTWQQKAEARQASAASKIPPEWHLPASIQAKLAQDPNTNVLGIPAQTGILTPRELEITGTPDATTLLSKLAKQEYTSVEVTTAFCKRAAIAQQLTNCLTETFFDKAVARAKELDEHLASTGKTTGPFHGLPISLKESFNITGIPTTLGFISWLDKPLPTTDSAVVKVLLAAGAVLYVKTNIPQTMMTADSQNNVFGRTLNPHGRHLTAGGSTGGEGALLALRGSILGVGTDIGGSIRIPALCCGVTGFKPSAGRVPFADEPSAGRRGLAGIAAVAGPLCHSIRDAELFMRVMAESHPDNLDDTALGIPWSPPSTTPNTLTIGILPEDPARPYHPSMQRTLTDAANKLSAAGHNLIDLSNKTPSLKEIALLAFRFFNMDPDRTILANIAAGEEPWIPSLKGTFSPDSSGPEPTLRDLYDMNITKAEISAAVRKVFLENGLDVILGAGYQGTAVAHDAYGAPVYTLLPNLVDYPACIIPFGKAEEGIDEAFVRDVEYIPPYDPKEVEGAPCHVQLIGRRLKDEKLVQDTKIIEDILGKK
ncbi:hypothetical protein BBP40_008447 [Aspergillus hancockii]|nr:hypothetical protein BBP40_008447 [Aspergillus hancockii]